MVKLIVEPKTARLYRDTDTFGKMDPYVTIQCGSEKKKSKTHKSGGKNPSWSDALTVKANDDTLTITVWDEDVGSDDFIGSAAIDVSKIQYGGGLRDWVSIYHKGKEAGQVYLEITVADKTKSYGTSYATPSYGVPSAPTYTPPAPSYAPSAPAYPAGSYYAAPVPAPAPAPTTYSYSTAPAGYYPTSPGVYAPAPAPAYPTAYPTAPAPAPAYPTTYTYAAPAPAPAYPSSTGGYPGAAGSTYQAPPSGGYGHYPGYH